jgi:hypothetical protein
MLMYCKENEFVYQYGSRPKSYIGLVLRVVFMGVKLGQ